MMKPRYITRTVFALLCNTSRRQKTTRLRISYSASVCAGYQKVSLVSLVFVGIVGTFKYRWYFRVSLVWLTALIASSDWEQWGTRTLHPMIGDFSSIDLYLYKQSGDHNVIFVCKCVLSHSVHICILQFWQFIWISLCMSQPMIITTLTIRQLCQLWRL